MELLQETARAKVNLTLKVIGRRADGFHEIESLAAFAGVSDRLELRPGGDATLSSEGPFAADLGDSNLVLEAAHLLCAHRPGIRAGAFHLEKRLPVAAGLGGGSADAGAALRLLQQVNVGEITQDDLALVARKLGSDVPVCLTSRAAHMRGRGENVSLIGSLPVLPAVLVNPGAPLGSGDVYAALGANVLPESHKMPAAVQSSFASAGDLVEFIRATGSDLEAAAIELAPVVADVCDLLSATDGCQIAQMSGSGSTCFGIYHEQKQADVAARSLAKSYPDWWVVSTDIG